MSVMGTMRLWARCVDGGGCSTGPGARHASATSRIRLLVPCPEGSLLHPAADWGGRQQTLVVSMNMDACHSSPEQELAQLSLCLPRPKASVRLGGMVLSDQ